MTENWRNHYDSWKLASGITEYVDEDGEPIDPDLLADQAEDAAIERAERAREDAMFDAPEREERIPYDDRDCMGHGDG